MSGEWVDWHQGYANEPARQGRLSAVQSLVRKALEDAPPGPVRVLSLCCGDGRDLLGVLADHPRAREVRARLIDLEPKLLETGRAEARRLGLDGVEFVQADAGDSSSFEGAVPAELVLACGIFGNISDADVRQTVGHFPELLAEHGTVIWTRGRFPPDLTPSIRDWFRRDGFEELAFLPVPDSTATAAAHRLLDTPRPYRPDQHLFTFLPMALRPSSRGRDPSP